jgi:hypothetical protein
MVLCSAEPLLGSEADDGPLLDDTPVALGEELDGAARSPDARDSKRPNQTTLRITSTARTRSVSRSLRLRPGRTPLEEN